MTGSKHDPDAELVAQGIGNMVAPFFGGIAATGALARTADQRPLRGALAARRRRSTRSSCWPAVLLLAPLLGYLPMASLAALLLLVAWNMSEWRHFVAPAARGAAQRRAGAAHLLRAHRGLRHGGRGDGRRSCWRRCCSCAAWPRSRGCTLVGEAHPTARGAAAAAACCSTRSRARCSSAPPRGRWASLARDRRRGVKVVVLDVTRGAGDRRHRPRGPGVAGGAPQRRGHQGDPGRGAGPAHARLRPGGLAQPQGPAAHLPLLRARDRRWRGRPWLATAHLARAADEPNGGNR